jgi:hypothetical protein
VWYDAGMAEETSEEKLLRYETILDLQIREIDRLRAENERLRTVAGAHGVLKEIYLDPEAPQGNRIKAAIGALPHEIPKLQSVSQLELSAEPEPEPLAELVHRQRMRADRLLALSLEERAALIPGLRNSNGDGQD